MLTYREACQYCHGESGKPATAVDHIFPVNPQPMPVEGIVGFLEARGLGNIAEDVNSPRNLLAACAPCNGSKSGEILPDVSLKEKMALAASNYRKIIDLKDFMLVNRHLSIGLSEIDDIEQMLTARREKEAMMIGVLMQRVKA